MHATNPPLLPNLQIVLEKQQEIRTRHRPTSKEVLSHPSAIEIIWRVFVRKNVHKEFPAWFEGARDFGHE
jgi:hypothetical protein